MPDVVFCHGHAAVSKLALGLMHAVGVGFVGTGFGAQTLRRVLGRLQHRLLLQMLQKLHLNQLRIALKIQRYGIIGWEIKKDGSITANNITARGNIQATSLSINSSVSTGARTTMTDEVIKVYDASGTLRVKLGDLSA